MLMRSRALLVASSQGRAAIPILLPYGYIASLPPYGYIGVLPPYGYIPRDAVRLHPSQGDP